MQLCKLNIILLFSVLHICQGCEIIVKNVGQVNINTMDITKQMTMLIIFQNNFTWQISYANGPSYHKKLGPGQLDNYTCTCLPHDMEIVLDV